jgi:hypothetical protein
LDTEFGRGYGEKNLRRMVQCAEMSRIEGWSTRTLQQKSE